MYKRSITYENFYGEEVTKDFYFNLTKTELTEMEVLGEDGSYADYIQRIVKAENRAALITEFKKLILMAYGERSEDGEYFLKNDEIREKFAQSAAYDKLFMEFATNDEAASVFMQGILPSDMRTGFDKTAKTIQAPPLSEPSLPPPAQ